MAKTQKAFVWATSLQFWCKVTLGSGGGGGRIKDTCEKLSRSLTFVAFELMDFLMQEPHFQYKSSFQV